MKNLIIVSGVAILCLIWGIWEHDGRITAEKGLEKCIDEKEAFKNAQKSSCKIVKQARVEANKGFQPADCYNQPLPDYLVRLQQQLK